MKTLLPSLCFLLLTAAGAHAMDVLTRYRIWFTMRHVSDKPDNQARVLVFCSRPPLGKTGPFALQMHNAGLFEEYKDIEIEVNPSTDNLITLHQASDGSRTVKGRSVNEFPDAPTRSSP